jgi:hypothetical protein
MSSPDRHDIPIGELALYIPGNNFSFTRDCRGRTPLAHWYVDCESEYPEETMKQKTSKKQMGDVLGISNTPASTHIPQATTDHGGHPQGIEVRKYRRHSGTDELQPGSGATGADMGSGGDGTDIEIEGATPGERKRPGSD